MKHSTSSSLVSEFSNYCIANGLVSFTSPCCNDTSLFILYESSYKSYCSLTDFLAISDFALGRRYLAFVTIVDNFLCDRGYNFTLSEFLRSDIAYSSGISNKLYGVRRLYIIYFFTLLPLLQIMRSYYGLPMRITSGYRSPKVNKLCGGRPHSRHLCLKAADFKFPSSVSSKDVEVFADSLSFRYVRNYGTYLHVDIE